MLIRSQDKKILTKFETITIFPAIDFNNEAKENEKIMITYTKRIGANSIGTYSSEEKALKVLDMIQEAYLKNAQANLSAGTLTVNKNTVFQMPQDDEVEA